MNYSEPTTVDEALDVLAERGDDAKLLAGGQSLLILMREGLVRPDLLVGLSGIPALRELEANGGARVGAMVTHATLAGDGRIAEGWPLLGAAERSVSTVQVRNRGTLGGSVAHAFPTADAPAALIASDARVVLASRRSGLREVPAEDFFVGVMETVAEPDELVTAITLPSQPDGAGWAYLKYVIRPLDFAIVGVAARVVLAGDGTIAEARIGLNGAANHTLRATEAEAALTGREPTPEVLAQAGRAAAAQSKPLADVDGSEGYKRRVVGVYTARALHQALG
jgi:carbon-monoxide dehydrogenase medium subunit